MKKYIENIKKWLSSYQMKDWHAIVLLILSILAYFSPLLFFGKILMNADSTYLAYPSAYFFGHFFGSPISNFLFSGYPVPVAFEYGYFHPLYNLFYYLFDFLFAYHSLLFLDYVGAALFTYWFARKIGLSIYASLLASFSYTFGQFSIDWLGVPSVANAVFLLPAVMYCVLQLANLKKKYIFIFGVIIGLAFLATHYEFVVMALIGGGVFFIYEIWLTWSKEHSPRVCLKQIIFFCLGILIALLISLPQALDSLNFFSYTTRSTILVYYGAPYLDLLKYLIPTFNIADISLTEFRPYIGIAGPFFALIGVWAIFRRKISENRSRFFLWFFIVTLLMCMQYTPAIFIIKNLPFVKYFTDQSRWIYLVNFAVVILAAFGFDLVLKGKGSLPTLAVKKLIKRLSIFFVSFFVVVNAVLIVFGKKIVVLIQNYFDAHLYAKTTHLPLQYYHDLIVVMLNKILQNVSFSNPNTILFLIFIVCLYFILKVTDKKMLFSNLIIVFVVVNMLSVALSTFKIGNRNLLTDESHIAQFIHAHESSDYDYRVFGFIVPFAQYQEINALHPEAEKDSLIFAKEALMGNLNVFSEIPIVGGYNPMAFRRYENIVAFLEDTTARKTTDDKVSLLLTQLPLLSALNVKYIVSPYVLKSDDLNLVFSEKVTSFDVPLYLYQNKNVLPRFYLAKNISILTENDEKDSFAQVTKPGINFNEQTFIECDACTTYPKAAEQNGTAKLVGRDSNKFKINVTSNSEEWLIISEEAIPGWSASIDGFHTKIYYANHSSQAVLVPAGNHIVTFSYNAFPTI